MDNKIEDLDDILRDWFDESYDDIQPNNNIDDTDNNSIEYELLTQNNSNDSDNFEIISSNQDSQISDIILNNKFFNNINFNNLNVTVIDFNKNKDIKIITREYIQNYVTKKKNRLINKVNILSNYINNNKHMNRFSHVVNRLFVYIDTYYDNYYDDIISHDKHINYDVDYDKKLKNIKLAYKNLKNEIDNYIDIFDYLK